MSADAVKTRIQSAYRQLLEARDLTPRYGQRLMIAEITNTLAGLAEQRGDPAPICVVEAGTGTGKTLAYLLATVPLARELGYQVVVATATVALQEQVVLKDIPELLAGSDLQFSYGLAKGRGRYLCLAKLDQALQGGASLEAMRDLYGEELDDERAGDSKLYQEMLSELGSGNWQGDRDDWKEPVSEANWRPLTVDKYQCSGPRCSHFRNCCFYRARDSLDKADCIIANHDLVLTDLALGGGAILPQPEKCIYVFDEAHHLPLKSNAHFSAFTRVRGSIAWLERCQNLLLRLTRDQLLDAGTQDRLQQQMGALQDQLRQSLDLLQQIMASLESADSYDAHTRYAFELGVVPDSLRELAANLAAQLQRLTSSLQQIADDLRQDMEDDQDAGRRLLAEQYFAPLGSNIMRAEANLQLWSSYAEADQPGQAPSARWLSVGEEETEPDIGLSSSPVLAAGNLRTRLWDCCAGAVLTSATLSALGSFDMLAMRAGLPEQTRYLSIPSPFDFQARASLVIPRMHCDPSEVERHTESIVRALPRLVDKQDAALMLFSSRRQMFDVLQNLPADWRELVLCQDDYQKAQLLKYHRQRVDRGEGSIIFGLASFAEGVDLPGGYCTHVLIAKIPFAVPNDPVEMTLSAWVEQQGHNAFMTLAVPDAALRLVQASGRLLRSETDSGRITLFDERLVNRHYGKKILDSMPPYRREIFELDIGV